MGTPLYNTDIIPLTSRPTLTVMDDGDYFVILDTSTGKISKILRTDVQKALSISYDNTTSGLTATQVQAALDELVVNLGSSDSAISAIKGTGWNGENLVDHEMRINTLERGLTLDSWADVRSIVRLGLARKYLSVGDQFLANYNGSPVVWNVIGIDHPGLVPTDPRFTHTLALQTQDCLFNAQFSAPQAIYGSTKELPAGTYIFTLNGVQYTFTSTESMPANGVLVGGGWTDFVPSTITIYGANRRDVIESGIAVTTTSGTDNLTPINDHYRCRYGSNEYAKSAIRQFLNSNEAVFNWEPQGLYDMPSSYSGAGGFLYRLDPELVAVMGEVENKVALPTYDGGGQVTFQDKAFLLSRVEVGLGSEGVTTGESVYEFYDGVTDAERIKLLSGSPRYWWLRSPIVGYTYYTRDVYPSGTLYTNHARDAIGLSPACVIY